MPLDVLATDALPESPVNGRPEQLLILLPAFGAAPASMRPLAQALRSAFAQAMLLAPADLAPAFTDDAATRAGRLQQLHGWVQAAQQASGVGPAATALCGFGEGAMAALELASLHDGLAGRVLAFGGRYATLPEHALEHTTIHLFHGADDTVVPAAEARAALERLGALAGDATIDIAARTGHVLAPVLVDCALQRLRTHIPARTWAAALGAARRPREDGDTDD